jgi:hypothetical protein
LLDHPPTSACIPVIFGLFDESGENSIVLPSSKHIRTSVATFAATLPSCEWVTLTTAIKQRPETDAEIRFMIDKEQGGVYSMKYGKFPVNF